MAAPAASAAEARANSGNDRVFTPDLQGITVGAA